MNLIIQTDYWSYDLLAGETCAPNKLARQQRHHPMFVAPNEFHLFVTDFFHRAITLVVLLTSAVRA